MINIITWIAVGLCIITVIIVGVTFLFGNSGQEPSRRAATSGEPAVEVSADRGSVITVRKVGGATRVEIRSQFYGVGEEDYDEGVPLAPPSVEVTKATEPELYREYMSAKTTAARKYEIIDYIYGMGLTLPLIPGLHEQFLKETETRKPEKPKHKTLNIDRKVADTPMPSMSEQPDAPVRLEPEEQLIE